MIASIVIITASISLIIVINEIMKTRINVKPVLERIKSYY